MLKFAKSIPLNPSELLITELAAGENAADKSNAIMLLVILATEGFPELPEVNESTFIPDASTPRVAACPGKILAILFLKIFTVTPELFLMP